MRATRGALAPGDSVADLCRWKIGGGSSLKHSCIYGKHAMLLLVCVECQGFTRPVLWRSCFDGEVQFSASNCGMIC